MDPTYVQSSWPEYHGGSECTAKGPSVAISRISLGSWELVLGTVPLRLNYIERLVYIHKNSM